jgi:hypothetical protein
MHQLRHHIAGQTLAVHPKVGQPKVEQSKVEQSKVGQPKAGQQQVGQPQVGQSKVRTLELVGVTRNSFLGVL